jgi:hypothetical protein
VCDEPNRNPVMALQGGYVKSFTRKVTIPAAR